MILLGYEKRAVNVNVGFKSGRKKGSAVQQAGRNLRRNDSRKFRKKTGIENDE